MVTASRRSIDQTSLDLLLVPLVADEVWHKQMRLDRIDQYKKQSPQATFGGRNPARMPQSTMASGNTFHHAFASSSSAALLLLTLFARSPFHSTAICHRSSYVEPPVDQAGWEDPRDRWLVTTDYERHAKKRNVGWKTL